MRVFRGTVIARRLYGTEYSKHSFLKELGLQERNMGVFDGEWFAHGAEFPSVNPSTGQTIAYVQGGSSADYTRVMKSISAARVCCCTLFFVVCARGRREWLTAL